MAGGNKVGGTKGEGKAAGLALTALTERLAGGLGGMTMPGVVRTLETLMILVLAYLMAGLFWQLFGGNQMPVMGAGPTSRTTTSSAPSDWSLLTRYDPFGSSVASSDTTSDLSKTPGTTLSLKLFGVRLAEPAEQSSAIIGTPDNKQGAYGIGDEVIKGVRLLEVHEQGVLLSRDGLRERLLFEGAEKSLRRPVTAPEAALNPESSAADKLSAVKDIGSFITQLRPYGVWNDGVFQGYGFGEGVSPSLLAGFGLTPGDVIVEVEGTPLSADTDLYGLIEAYEDEDTLSFTVRRDGGTETVKVEF